MIKEKKVDLSFVTQRDRKFTNCQGISTIQLKYFNYNFLSMYINIKYIMYYINVYYIYRDTVIFLNEHFYHILILLCIMYIYTELP